MVFKVAAMMINDSAFKVLFLKMRANNEETELLIGGNHQ